MLYGISDKVIFCEYFKNDCLGCVIVLKIGVFYLDSLKFWLNI